MQRALTSASNIFRRKLCPGSANQEAGLPDTKSTASTEGDLLHSYFLAEGLDRSPLTEDQLIALNNAEYEAKRFIAMFCEMYSIQQDEPHTIEREVTLSVTLPSGRELPGRSDYIIRFPQRDAAVVIDAKFGWLEVDEAEDNEQLATYAVQEKERHPELKAIGVAIVQPRNFGRRLSSAVYQQTGLADAANALDNIMAESEKPDAPLIPSPDACRYCKAKQAMTCPALTNTAIALPAQVPGVTAKTAAEILAALPDDRLGSILDAIKLASMLEKPAKSEALKRLESGGMDGWDTKKGATVKSVTDTLQAYALVKQVCPDLTDEQYMAACKLSIGALAETVALVNKMPKSKAEALVTSILEPVLELKQNAPSITRK